MIILDVGLLIRTLVYVTYAPYFWPSMGFTTAIAMFVGAMIYDGQLNQVKKGLLSVGSYVAMLLWVTLSRVVTMAQRTPDRVSEMTFAGIATILLITFFWVLGVFLGVWIISQKYQGQHLK